MMLSHYFIGFADGLDGVSRAGTEATASAMRCASDSLYKAVDKPVEGTILTVVRESTEAVERCARQVNDLATLSMEFLRAARKSLERTPRLLPVLRDAGVVDAGAKGFVRFVEGVVSLVHRTAGEMKLFQFEEATTRDAAAAIEFPESSDRAFRYCSEFLVRGNPLPEQPVLASAVRDLGGSLIVNRSSSVAKIHIHTNEPSDVERALTGLGATVERVKAEDMREQHRARRKQLKRRVAIVTDSTCDLPGELVIEHDITVVPLTVMFGDEAFLDQVEITHDEFLQKLIDPTQPRPTTSQPSPAQLDAAYTRAAETAEEVLGIFVSGALSGTLGQARVAAGRFSGASVAVHDSCSASLGMGFQVLRAAELARRGLGVAEIVSELGRLRETSGLLLTLDTLTYLQRSGRVGKARAFLGNLLDLKPVLSVDEVGAIMPVDKVRHRAALLPRVLELLNDRIPQTRKRLRMGVGHVLGSELMDELVTALQRRYSPDDILVRPTTGVISAHTGPGAWAVFYQAE